MRSCLALLATWIVTLACGQGEVQNESSLPNQEVAIRYFVDSTSSYSLAEVSSASFRARFQQWPEEVPNLLKFEGNVWFHFQTGNPLGQPLYLQLANVYVPYLDVYVFANDSLVAHRTTGFFRPYATRDLPFIYYHVLLDGGRQHNPTLNVYGKLKASRTPQWLPIKVGHLDELLPSAISNEVFTYAILAVIALMVVYNFVLYFLVRDTLYIRYILYLILAPLTFVLFHHGLVFAWFWPSSPAMNNVTWLNAFFYFGFLIFIPSLTLSSIFHLPTNSRIYFGHVLPFFSLATGANPGPPG